MLVPFRRRMERSSSQAIGTREGTGMPSVRIAGTGVAPWALLIAGAVVLASLSLLLPSAPTYDPWAWIIWGREITHLDLQTTDGPSWKPLPVMFTTVFSIFGNAAPELWLVVARAGAIMSLVAAFFLARRLGGGWVGGAAAVAGIAMAPWFMRNAAFGNSEPLLVALLLGAIERELAGRHKVAFLLGVGAALLRPEVWPFLAAYSVWVVYKRQIHWAWVAGAGVSVLALWTLPELWGSGDLLRAAHRAQVPNAGAPTFADNPALEVLKNARMMLTVPVFAGVAVLAVLAYRRRDTRPLWLLGFVLAWLGLVAYMTASEGFSGNNRYLIPAVAVLIVLAGAGFGLLADLIPQKFAIGAAVVLVAAFSAVGISRLDRTTAAIEYQANLVNSLPGLIERAGGAERLRDCGDIYTGPFLVPAVAWHMDVHSSEVGLEPAAPAVVFREKTDAGLHRKPVPPLFDVDGETLALAPNWRIVAECGA